LVAANVPKKVLGFAGYKDVYTSSRGATRTLGNFVKACFQAVESTYTYLSPDLWTPTHFLKSPYQEFTDHLKNNKVARPKKLDGRD